MYGPMTSHPSVTLNKPSRVTLTTPPGSYALLLPYHLINTPPSLLSHYKVTAFFGLLSFSKLQTPSITLKTNVLCKPFRWNSLNLRKDWIFFVFVISGDWIGVKWWIWGNGLLVNLENWEWWGVLRHCQIQFVIQYVLGL